MKLTPARVGLACIPAICLLLFWMAEKQDVVRSDSLAATACTPELFAGSPDGWNIVAQFSHTILMEAEQHQLPPEVLAAIIYGHQRELTPFRRFTDCAGSALGHDLSLGLGQIRISTAADNDSLDVAAISPATFKQYRRQLLDPVQNIRAQARELRLLLERNHRYPGIAAQQLIHDPFAMALLMSEYRMGRQSADNSSSRLSAAAFGDLAHVLDSRVFMFGRDSDDVVQIQRGVQQYLDFIHCESGIFNAKACAAWYAAPARKVPDASADGAVR